LADQIVDCAICHRPRAVERCEVLELTADEKKAMRQMGQTPEDKLYYCRPCWRVVTNREQGAALMKGMAQVQLQRAGVTNAETVATKFHERLLKLVEKGGKTNGG